MTTGDEKILNTSRQERYLKAVELLDSAHSYTNLQPLYFMVNLKILRYNPRVLLCTLDLLDVWTYGCEIIFPAIHPPTYGLQVL